MLHLTSMKESFEFRKTSTEEGEAEEANQEGLWRFEEMPKSLHFILLAMVIPPIFCKSIWARPISMKAIVLRN